MATQLAGEDILASDIVTPKYLSKASTETVTSSAVLQNDDDFVVSLPVGVWRVELFAHVSNAAAADTGDIRSAWATTGTITSMGRSVTGAGPASVDNTGSVTTAGSGITRSSGHGLTTAVITGITDDAAGLLHEDLLLNVTVAGVLTFQWAQGTSNATGTAISTASRMYLTQLEAF
jgi:hypothetical protein